MNYIKDKLDLLTYEEMQAQITGEYFHLVIARKIAKAQLEKCQKACQQAIELARQQGYEAGLGVGEDWGREMIITFLQDILEGSSKDPMAVPVKLTAMIPPRPPEIPDLKIETG